MKGVIDKIKLIVPNLMVAAILDLEYVSVSKNFFGSKTEYKDLELQGLKYNIHESAAYPLTSLLAKLPSSDYMYDNQTEEFTMTNLNEFAPLSYDEAGVVLRKITPYLDGYNIEARKFGFGVTKELTGTQMAAVFKNFPQFGCLGILPPDKQGVSIYIFVYKG